MWEDDEELILDTWKYKAVKSHSFPLMLFGYQLELICGSVRCWA